MSGFSAYFSSPAQTAKPGLVAASGIPGSSASGGGGGTDAETFRYSEFGGAAISVNGLREQFNNYMIDGLDNNDRTVGGASGAFSQESIREFQVLTNSFSAEYGRHTGAVVNAATKTLLFLTVPTRGWLAGVPFAISALAVAGVPPVSGFWAKAAVIRATMEPPGWATFVLAAVVLIGGVLSFVYMFQIYQRTYWEGDRQSGPVSTRGRRVIVALVAGFVLLAGVVPGPLLEVSERAAATLPGGDP